MWRGLLRHRTDWLAGGLHVLIASGAGYSFAAGIPLATALRYAVPAMGAVSFFAWIGNFRRYRQVHDVPTSRIASAAQGYVGLYGHSALIPKEAVRSPLLDLPCCWYRYRLEEKDGDGDWRVVEEGESTSHFFIVDDSGKCYVAPAGAEVLYPRMEVRTTAESRCTEWLLRPNDPLYALGEFSSFRSGLLERDRNREVSALLAAWKADKRALLQRFDKNRDGELDPQEWEAARAQARSQVETGHADAGSDNAGHLLSKPADGRVFLLAAALPERLGRRFALWSWLHLAAFFAACVAFYFVSAVVQPLP